MPLATLISDIYEALTVSEVHAEAPPAEEQAEEAEEEEEEEPEDVFPALQEECAKTKECAPAKHHYDECVERVTAVEEAGETPKEDCVEEFFHLVHCTTQCAAPKLWAQLK
ncbi:Non-heme 11 kDa protein of cytochrome bc1 complex [Ascodesmis nigricans]|uniref:Cytochrome b-c1 complex subunit 6, mitochondrial n=1 Tax=Ascodesmis nigricans TaxID=341454 RepID=A0A4S2N4K8_9PEZI|nr:Non-heme 11 kDa protein of cytochrome bc1 complex [Ascodesmis nigricans]